MNFLILLAVFGFVGYRLVPAADRARYLGSVIPLLQEVKTAVTTRRPQYEAFKGALRARTQHVVLAPALAAITAAFFCAMAFGPGSIGDPGTLVDYGASIGTRTTNGEWWRLVTAIFLPRSLFHTVVTAAVLMHAGVVLERLVGRWAFAAVFFGAGIFTGLVNISSRPVVVTLSGTGALFGVYGLFVAALGWQAVSPRPQAADDTAVGEMVPATAQIPRIAIKRIGAVGLIFGLYTAVSGALTTGELAGFAVGLLYGVAVGWRVSDRLPATRLVGATAAGVLVAAVVSAMPLRNIADVAPEITLVVSTEARTTTKYKTAFEAFKKGKLSAETLAQVADRGIVPELQAVDARLASLNNVPLEHQSIVADAREFLRLRTRSWRARAEVVRRTSPGARKNGDPAADASGRIQAEAKFRSDMLAQGNAEGFERSSLQAFQRVNEWRP